MVKKISKKTPAIAFTELVRKSMTEIKADIPHLVKMGEMMGQSMLSGGKPFMPGVARFWPSEMGHRAGGLMCLGGKISNKKDVALFAVPDRRFGDPAKDKKLAKLLKGKAKLLVIGQESDLEGVDTSRVAAFTGGTSADRGLYSYNKYTPLASTRQFEQFVRGWIVLGEAVAACTREEKVPTLWMSVWLEGAMARNAAMSYTEYNNIEEPRDCPQTLPNQVFHRNRFIPPLAPGYAANEFLKMAEDFVGIIESQKAVMAKAGKWLSDTLKSGGKVWCVAVGHSYPRILDIDPVHFGEPRPWHISYDDPQYDYPLYWGGSASDILKGTPEAISKGDAALYLGYAPLIKERLDKILNRGVKFVHTSPYGLRKDIDKNYHENFMWFDLPWRPGDAQVDIRGYGARMMPGSSTSHSIAYNAVLCEIAQRMGWTA